LLSLGWPGGKERKGNKKVLEAAGYTLTPVQYVAKEKRQDRN